MADMSPCPVQEQTVPWNFMRSPPWNRPQKAHFTSWTSECRRINPMDLSNMQITVLVPGVVFTPTGSRYGYGKGFYDRYFARYAKLNRFALAYENQLEPELEVLDTDIKMYRIYTETGEYDII